ncbi:putative MYND domain protein [Xylariaceae sp. FL1019]|nr:putative MYND domain protein [Xylariaceae sp. FL1019]
MSETCNTCRKSLPDLKQCAKCHTTYYCSRDCQKADWKTHKKICAKQAHDRSNAPFSSHGQSAGSTLSPPKGLDKPIAKPFTRLDNGTYLHDRPEVDVYRVLIDAYRMRIEDEYKFEGEAAEDSIYGGRPDSLLGFTKFLNKAARSGLLPSWWNTEKEAACKKLGMESEWHDLRCKVEKSDIIEHYGDSRYPMQLRMLAEAIIGRGFAGNDGSGMRQAMMMVEQGNVPGGGVASMATLDMTTGNHVIHHSQ